MEKTKIEKEGKINYKHINFLIHNTLGHPLGLYIFEEASSNESWEICDRSFCHRKRKNGQINRLISFMWLILLYTVQLIITKLYTNFQDPKSSSS